MSSIGKDSELPQGPEGGVCSSLPQLLRALGSSLVRSICDGCCPWWVGCYCRSQEGQPKPEWGEAVMKFPLEGCRAFFWSERKSEMKEGMWGSVEGAPRLGEAGGQRGRSLLVARPHVPSQVSADLTSVTTEVFSHVSFRRPLGGVGRPDSPGFPPRSLATLSPAPL